MEILLTRWYARRGPCSAIQCLLVVLTFRCVASIMIWSWMEVR